MHILLKHIIFLLIVFVSAERVFAQNVDFVEENFKDRKKELFEIVKLINEANTVLEQEEPDYPYVLSLFGKAYEFNPNSAKLNYKIGTTYLNSGGLDSAIVYINKAIAIDAKVDKEALLMVGQAHHLKMELDKALDYYTRYRNQFSKEKTSASYLKADKKVKEVNNLKQMINQPLRVKIENLGHPVNSKYTEYGPIVNADESQLFFTSYNERESATLSKGKKGYVFSEDIYIANRKDSVWEIAPNPGMPLNNFGQDAVVGIAPDGQTLLIYKSDGGGDIFYCKLDGKVWSKAKPLDKTINSKSHESTASFSYDGRTLFFDSDRPGGYGEHDIYMSSMTEQGTWGPAINLGPMINTSKDEINVFCMPDGKTIYFSSSGHDGIGGYDIYKSSYEKKKWTKPVNIGYPINTPYHDNFFSMTADGLHAYYSSEKVGGMGNTDIYRVTFLPPEIKQDTSLAKGDTIKQAVNDGPKLTLVTGKVVDLNGLPIKAKIEVIDLNTNKVIAVFESNSETGKYMLSLPSGKNYGVNVSSENYLFVSENFDIAESEGFVEVKKVIPLQKAEAGAKIVLNNIFFQSGSATLNKTSTNEIDRLFKILTDNPSMMIEISGHTDNTGTADVNVRLSNERAKAVAVQLTKKGIPANRIVSKGYGFEQPVADNSTEAGRQKNRRTEFKVVSK